MADATLKDVTHLADQLSQEDQQYLVDHLTRHLRQKSGPASSTHVDKTALQSVMTDFFESQNIKAKPVDPEELQGRMKREHLKKK